ncbi:MAG: hypothetical protein RLZZ324_262, partial [Candidatus Parcubacteria bacterium]
MNNMIARTNMKVLRAVAALAFAFSTFAASALVAAPALAQNCPYNSTQSSCACPTSGSGVTCFGGQLFRSTDASCQADTRPGAQSNQLFACSSTSFVCNTAAFPCGGCTAATSTIGASCGSPSSGQYTNQCGACGCPAGTQLCGGTNACVAVLACPAGSTFDPCTNSCSTPNILKDQAAPQSAFINVTGNIKSSAGDYYVAPGKAIRVDSAGVSTLNVGNYGGGPRVDTTFNGNLLVGNAVAGNFISFYNSNYKITASSGLEIYTQGGDVMRFINGVAEMARFDGTGKLGI